MSKPRGGKRPGSGRKAGSKTVNRRSAEIDKGVLPLDMRLRVARKMWAEAVDEAGEITDLTKAQAAAEFAEPATRFTSPTLSAIDARLGFDLTKLSDEDLDVLDRISRKAAAALGDRS
jgi:hypothetical protein